MPETRKPVQPVSVDYVCDECGTGKMRFGGIVWDSYPPQYPHGCTNCKANKVFHRTYPYIAYLEDFEAQSPGLATLTIAD